MAVHQYATCSQLCKNSQTVFLVVDVSCVSTQVTAADILDLFSEGLNQKLVSLTQRRQ